MPPARLRCAVDLPRSALWLGGTLLLVVVWDGRLPHHPHVRLVLPVVLINKGATIALLKRDGDLSTTDIRYGPCVLSRSLRYEDDLVIELVAAGVRYATIQNSRL